MHRSESTVLIVLHLKIELRESIIHSIRPYGFSFETFSVLMVKIIKRYQEHRIFQRRFHPVSSLLFLCLTTTLLLSSRRRVQVHVAVDGFSSSSFNSKSRVEKLSASAPLSSLLSSFNHDKNFNSHNECIIQSRTISSIREMRKASASQSLTSPSPSPIKRRSMWKTSESSTTELSMSMSTFVSTPNEHVLWMAETLGKKKKMMFSQEQFIRRKLSSCQKFTLEDGRAQFKRYR